MDRIIPLNLVSVVDAFESFGQLIIPEFSLETSPGQMYHLREHILQSKEDINQCTLIL